MLEVIPVAEKGLLKGQIVNLTVPHAKGGALVNLLATGVLCMAITLTPKTALVLTDSNVENYLTAIGLTGSNAGGDFTARRYWLPSGDSASAPRWASEAEFFAQFTRAGSKYVIGQNGNLTSIATNVVPFGYSLGAWRLFPEGGATNLSTYSSDTSNAVWTPSAGTKTSGQPDVTGGTGAALFTADGTNSGHFIINSTSIAYTSGQVYTLSYFVKAGTNNIVQLSGSGAIFGTAQYANFQLTAAGVVGNSAGLVGSPVIRAFGNGWYRISISVTATASGNSNAGIVYIMNSLTDTRGQANTKTTNIYVFGSQLEASSFASSYIETAGSAVSRAPDSCRLPTAMEGVLQRTAASVLVRGRLLVPNASAASRRILGLTGSSFLLGAANASETVARSFNGTNSLDATFGSGNFVTGFGEAMAFDGSGRSHCVNGGTVTSDANSVGDRSTVYLGRDAALSNIPGNGLYGLVAGFPSRLSNAALQALAVA